MYRNRQQYSLGTFRISTKLWKVWTKNKEGVRLTEFSWVWAYIPVQRLATLAFFFATVQTRVEALDLAPDLEQAVLIQLIPALHLERCRRAQPPDPAPTPGAQRAVARSIRQRAHPLQALAPALRTPIEEVGRGCGDPFQCSGSCVEGRNGHLSLYHHGCHALSDRKLATLTAIHNFHIRRPDDTTPPSTSRAVPLPAIRPVLRQVPFPPSPRQRRPRRAGRPT